MTFISWTTAILFSVLPFKINMFLCFVSASYLAFRVLKIILKISHVIATSELSHLHIALSATSCPVRLFFACEATVVCVDRWRKGNKNFGTCLLIANLRFNFFHMKKTNSIASSIYTVFTVRSNPCKVKLSSLPFSLWCCKCANSVATGISTPSPENLHHLSPLII